MKTKGLSLDQGPPLAIPLSFFFAGPVFLVAAAALITLRAEEILRSPWSLSTLALTHAGTLGFLMMVMLGALYQMLPVVAAARIPGVGWSHLTQVLLAAGVAGFLLAGFLEDGHFLAVGAVLVALGLALFLLPVAWALFRTTAHTPTVWGMRLSWLGLLLVLVTGLAMSRGFGSGTFPGNRALWIQVHLSLGLTCWVGALIVSVSWQVDPMFHLAPRVPLAWQRLTLACIALSLVALPVTLALENTIPLATLRQLSALAASPAAFVVWLLHPLLMARTIRNRRRKRSDATLLFWKAGLSFAPLTLVAAALTLGQHDVRFGLILGWLAAWGWAGCIVHGMLHRIVPFLVWFHLLSSHVGMVEVPSTRRLLPDPLIKRSFRLHLTTLALGIAAIALQADVLMLATAAGLALTAASLLTCMVGALAMALRTDLTAAA